MITVHNLVKQFGDKRVLDDINLSFAKGKTTAIIGPSGSGKTTLLRCLNLLEMPTSGRIVFDDWHYDFAPERQPDTPQILQLRRKSGMVFQSFNLFPHMTVEQNITEGPVTVQKRNPADAVRQALEQFLSSPAQ